MDLNKILNTLQYMCDELYEEYGASDDVIKLQIAINGLRNTHDIADKSKITESDKGFVQ